MWCNLINCNFILGWQYCYPNNPTLQLFTSALLTHMDIYQQILAFMHNFGFINNIFIYTIVIISSDSKFEILYLKNLYSVVRNRVSCTDIFSDEKFNILVSLFNQVGGLEYVISFMDKDLELPCKLTVTKTTWLQHFRVFSILFI